MLVLLALFYARSSNMLLVITFTKTLRKEQEMKVFDVPLLP